MEWGGHNRDFDIPGKTFEIGFGPVPSKFCDRRWLGWVVHGYNNWEVVGTHNVAVTIGAWTSINNKSFITSAAHFVDDKFNLREFVLQTRSYTLI